MTDGLVEAIKAQMEADADDSYSFDRAAHSALAAIKASGFAVVQGWQDIANAPRDESRFLIAYTVRGDGPQVREGCWHVEQQCFTSVNGFLIFDTAYAWMPLPAAPIAAAGEG